MGDMIKQSYPAVAPQSQRTEREMMTCFCSVISIKVNLLSIKFLDLLYRTKYIFVPHSLSIIITINDRLYSANAWVGKPLMPLGVELALPLDMQGRL